MLARLLGAKPDDKAPRGKLRDARLDVDTSKIDELTKATYERLKMGRK